MPESSHNCPKVTLVTDSFAKAPSEHKLTNANANTFLVVFMVKPPKSSTSLIIIRSLPVLILSYLSITAIGNMTD